MPVTKKHKGRTQWLATDQLLDKKALLFHAPKTQPSTHNTLLTTITNTTITTTITTKTVSNPFSTTTTGIIIIKTTITPIFLTTTVSTAAALLRGVVKSKFLV